MIRQSLDLSPPASFDALFTNLCWVPFTATLTSVSLNSHLGDTHFFSLITVLHREKSATRFSIYSYSSRCILHHWIFVTTFRSTATCVSECVHASVSLFSIDLK